MKFQLSTLAAVAGVVAPALAGAALGEEPVDAPAENNGIRTTTLTKCYTTKGTTSLADVPTSYTSFTWEETVTSTEKVTKTSTRTPATVTSTDTTISTSDTTIILPRATNTVHATTYTDSTTILTADTTTYYTTADPTTTVVNVVQTIPTADGFQPVGSTLPGAAQKRSIGHPKLEARAKAKQYPIEVNCNVNVWEYSTTVVTKTVAKTAITNAPTPTTVTTSTSVTIVTHESAPNPDATTVTDITETNTIPTTTTPSTTITSTSTVTESIPTSTFYAACDSSYLAGSINGQGVGAYYDTKNRKWANTADTAAYDCCVSCIIDPACAAAAFDASANAGSQCMVDTKGGQTCPVYNPAAVLDGEPGSGLTIMNGNCGGFKKAT